MILTPAQFESADAADRLPRYHLDPSAMLWRREGATDPLSTLRATLEIGGAKISLFAIEVAGRDDVSTQYVVDALQWDQDALWQAYALDGAVRTVEIGGRHYVLFACPEAK